MKKVCQKVLIKYFGLQIQNQNPRFAHKNTFFAFLGAAIDPNCHPPNTPSPVPTQFDRAILTLCPLCLDELPCALCSHMSQKSSDFGVSVCYEGHCDWQNKAEAEGHLFQDDEFEVVNTNEHAIIQRNTHLHTHKHEPLHAFTS